MSNMTQPAFVLECRTGCTCCQDENHYRGPFANEDICDAAIKACHEVKVLASQYAPNGRYVKMKVEAEILPDGRVIIDSTRVVARFIPAEEATSDEARINNLW